MRLDFFTDKNGDIRYADRCMRCAQDCKQSYRVKIISCKKFVEKKEGGAAPLK